MRPNTSNTEEFILKAIKIHGNKYNYSLVNYINSRTKVDIICLKHGVFRQRSSQHLLGAGCKKCSTDNHRVKLDAFLEKCKKIYGDRYDYSSINYSGTKNNINVICKIHGIFKILAEKHTAGFGCSKCLDNRYEHKIHNTKTKQDYFEEFLIKSRTKHGDKYGYDSVEYVNVMTPVKIYCKKHGYFWQRPNVHTMGCGCRKCGNIIQGNRKTKSEEKFIVDAQKIHGDKYDYSQVQYVSSHIKVKIICKKHGIFMQQPSLHLCGYDCERCGYEKIQRAAMDKALSPEEFLKKAKDIHGDKYDYSLTQYVIGENKIKIICKKHGVFEQRLEHHIGLKQGCPKCAHIISNPEIDWLDSLNIPQDKNHRHVSIKINNKLFRVDGFSQETKTIYEFNGDYFHGNPDKFDPKDVNTKVNKTFGELYQRTIEKEYILKQAGYNVISIWESDFKKLQYL